MDERDPLLSRPEENNGSGETTRSTARQTDSGRSKRHKNLRCLAVILATVALVLVITATTAALSGTILYVILAHSYKNNSCENLTLSVRNTHTRSGSFSSLVEIPSGNVLCYKLPLHVTLNSYISTVEVYQTPCEDVDTDPFQISYQLSDITIDGGPIPVFDENFSPQNYFYGEGQIGVDIINLTSSQTSVTVAVCLFTCIDEYSNFKRAEKNWKNFTSTAKCNSIAVESGKSYESTINITDKSFVFVGMASTDVVHIGTLKINAFGQDIARLGENSTKVCQLNGGRTECTFNLQASMDGKDVCILAYQDDNPDGSYGYSNVTLSLSKRDRPRNPYDKRVKSFGFSFGGLMLLWLVLIAVVIISVVVYRKRKLEDSTGPIQASEDDQPEETSNAHTPGERTINNQRTFN